METVCGIVVASGESARVKAASLPKNVPSTIDGHKINEMKMRKYPGFKGESAKYE